MDDYISMAELAQLAEVRPPAVSNWRRRHADFPRPKDASERELFRVADLASWLSRRKIARDDLRHGESVGATYGDRFRKNLGDPKTVAVDAGSVPHPRAMPRAAAADGAGRPERSQEASARNLWKALDKLRGFAAVSDYRYVVLSMFYVRITDDARWAELTRAAHSSRLRGLGELLADTIFRLEGSGPGAVAPSEGKLLRNVEDRWLSDVVDAIDRIDVRGSAEAGQVTAAPAAIAFRFLLDRFAAKDGKRGGEFRTPESPARLAVGLTAPAPGERIYDPFCRSGDFLADAAVYAEQHDGSASDLHFFGEEPNHSTWRLAGMNLAVHGVAADLGAHPANALIDNLHAGRRFDVVLANPPFNAQWAGSDHAAHDVRWRYGVPPGHNGNFAWLQHISTVLAEKGRAAVVMPNSATSTQNPQERAIRAAMIEDGVVECIIALPSQLFYHTSIPVTLWLLRSPIGRDAGQVLFIDARTMGTMMGRTQRVLTDDDIDRVVSVHQEWRSLRPAAPYSGVDGLARSATVKEIRRHDYVLNPGRYVAASGVDVDVDIVVETIQELRRELDRLHRQAIEADATFDHQLSRIATCRP